MTAVRPSRILAVLAATIVLAGCATMRRREAWDTGDLLATAGFDAKPADTPERIEQLRAMPPLKLLSQSKNGHVVYRYADPYSCNCLYIGDEQAYREYRQLALSKELAEARLEGEEAADNMDWGRWGPWR